MSEQTNTSASGSVLHQSFRSVDLYRRSGQLQLPLSSVVEECKVAKWRATMTFRDSSDPKVRGADVTTPSGR